MEAKRLKRFSFLLMVSFVLISFWRGLWGLMDEYFFPSNYRLSLFMPLILSILALFFIPKILDELSN